MRLLIFINLLLTLTLISSADERCANQNVHGFAVQIAHPTDCRKFFKCDELHNLQVEICPKGLEYNPYLKVCVYPSGFCMINSTETVQSYYNCSNSQDGLKTPNYHDNCRSYIVCSSGISKIEICNDGKLYDSQKDDCTFEFWNVKCQNMQNSRFQISNVLKSNETILYPNLNNNCLSYFECNSYDDCKEIFCENDTIFDTYTKKCDNKTKIICNTESLISNRIKRNSGTNIDCSGKNVKWLEDKESKINYFICVNGIPYKKQCKDNQIFDVLTGACRSNIKQISYECDHGQFKPNDANCHQFFLCVLGLWQIQTCERNKYFSKKDNFCIPNDGSCAEDVKSTVKPIIQPNCIHGVFKAHATDCKQFQLCINGNWKDQSCEDDQYFNQVKNYCVPEDGTCESTTLKPECIHGQYKEYRDDCTQFYLCVVNKWRKQSCSDGQYFNTIKNYCVPEDGTCKTTTTKPDCIQGQYKEYRDDCTQFYLCVVGKWRKQSCSEGQYFNTIKNYCVPEDGTCKTTTTKPECIHGQYKEYRDDCTQFYLCVVGKWRKQSCSDGQYFNTIKNYCVPEDGTCITTTTKPECIHGQYKEYRDDCTQFYLCVVGKWRKQPCSDGQYFNTIKNYCVPEDGTCITTTTKPECIHGQYKEYRDDCTQFYLCVVGKWRKQSCSDGQYFNTIKNYCVPEDGTCRTTTTKPDCIHGQYKEYRDDCTQFYLCVVGKWRKQSCSDGQYFNTIKNYCVPEDGTCRTTTTKPDCIHGQYKEYRDDCTQFYLCVVGKWRKQSCSDGQYFNTIKNYCVPEDGTCRTTTTKPDCIHGQYKEYRDDCTQFYLCVVGKWRKQSCSDGQYFNTIKNYCVPEDGTCKTTTQVTSTTTTKIPPTQECIHGQYKGYSKDCTQFRLCVFGIWRIHTCPTNQYFNIKKNYCVPEDGSCRSTTITEPTTITTTTEPTTITTTHLTTKSTSRPNCVHGMYREHRGDCLRFELCVFGHWRIHTCGINKYFNPEKNYCVPEDGSCVSTTPSTSSTGTTPFCYHGQFARHPLICWKFLLCLNERWVTKSCLDDQYFDPIKNYCVPEDGTCRPTTTTTEKWEECIHGEFTHHEDECTYFKLCVHGYWRVHSCKPNQYFNRDKNYCIPEDGSCNPTTPTKSSTRATTTTPSSTTTTQRTTTTPTTTIKPECIHGQYKPHHECEKFILCVSGFWREQSCPWDQYFDVTKNYCVPDHGICRTTTASPTTTSTTTTPQTTTTKTTTIKPECIHGEFKPHIDCEKFMLCVSGFWREQSCPWDQYFDATKNYCVPDHGICRPTTTPSPTTTTQRTTTTVTTTIKPECIHGQYKKHEECEKFMLCVSGFWREQSCPWDQYFEVTKNYCVPDHGICRPTTTPSSTTTTQKTTTTPTTTIKPECIHGEFKEHDEECYKFKLCVSGIWRNQSCPNNQYFDKSKNYCVVDDGQCRPTTTSTSTTSTTTTPKSTTTSSSSTSKSTTRSTSTTSTPSTTPSTTIKPECIHGEFKEHEEECYKFQLCVSGIWRNQSCPNNQYFDKSKNYCVVDDGQCRPTTTSTSTTSTTTTPKSTTTSSSSTSKSTTRSTSTTSTPSTTPSTTIKPECIHGEFKEHEEECYKFQLCVSGIWRNQSCPNNQYFDKSKNYCVPDDGQCRPTTTSTSTTSTTTTPKSTTTSSSSTSESTTRTTTTTSTPSTTPSTTIKPECIHGEFKEHEEECYKFQLCVSGIWRNQSCPNNQYFDKSKNYCVVDDGQCRPTTTSTTTPSTTTTPKSTTTPSSSTSVSTTRSTTTTSTPSTTPSTTIKPECIHGEFKEHEEECYKFQLCVSGIWRNQSCPNNQYFDKSKNYCVPDDGQCSPTTTSTSTPPTTTTPKSTTTSSSSTSESTTRTTTTTSTPSTKPSTTIKPECIHGEFKEHEEECYKFQLCVSGIWRNQSCPNNQYFDKSKNYCVVDDGQCRPTTTSTSTTSTTTTPKSTTTSSSSTTESTTRSTTTTSTPSTTQSTTIKPECIHGEFKEHEEECYKFQLCVSGIWRNQSCPNNQYFDKTKNYCVVDDGQCRPTTTSTSTTSTTTTPKSTTTSSSSTTESTTRSTTTTSTPSTTPSTTIKPECIHGEFKEHEEECYKFQLCVSGIWRNQSCPNNQYFDRSKNYCVLDDGQCRPTTTSTSTTSTTTTPKSTTTSSSSTTESTTTSTSTTSTPSTTQSTTIKPECIHGEFKEHEEECYKFQLCVSGIWRNQSCPNNQYFDRSKNYCVLDDGQCRPTTTSTSTTSTTTTPKSTTTSSSSTTESTTTSTSTTSTPSTTQSTTIKPECIHGEFKEHEEKCYKFQLCVSGIWRNQSCPNNQYFDKSKNYCVVDDGQCRPTTTSTSTTSTTTTPKSTTTSSSSTTESTTTSTSTTSTPSTTQSTTIKPECIHGEFKKHEEECYKFQLCVSGIWRNQSCPNNQYFDRSKNYCVLDDGQCRPTTTSTSTTSTTTTPKSTTTSSSSTTESTTTSTSTTSTPSTTQSTTIKPECIHGEFKEHEEECYKFQLCVSGIWRNQSCPNNQYFDKSKNYCVVDDGQCRPTTTSTSTTSTTTTPKSTTTSSSSTTESTTRSTTTTSTPSTTPSTTIKPECIHGEFKEHEEECYKFQLCVSGIWRNQSCPNNQYFDRSKNYCVLDDGQCRPTTTSTSTTSTTTTPKSTTTSTSSTTESTTTSTSTTSTPSTTQSTTVKPECIHGEFKEHEEECYKFQLCVSGIWRNQSCPNNQYFDRSKNYCVLDDGQCRPTTTSTSTTSTTTTPKSTTTSSSSTTESTTTSTSTTSTPSTTQSTTIKPECIHGEFKEHEEECYKFQLCVSGIWRNQSCPNNQYFDRSKNYCVLDDGQCRPTTTSTSTTSTTTTPKSTTTSSSSTTESTTTSTSTTSTPSTTQSTTVKPECIHGEFKEHDEECYKFKLCVNGTWRNQSCPNNQYFDRSKNYCVLDDGQCRPTTTSTSTPSTTTTPKSTTTSSSSTTESTTRSTTTASTPSTTQSTTIKPECIHGEFKEHEEECYKFQLCVSGIWRNQSCPNNQFFDRSKNYCVLDDGQCRPTTTSTSTTSTTTTPKSTTTSSSSTTESTTTSTSTTSTPSTTQSTTVKPECIHGEFKEHDEECYKFKLCVNGIWRNQSCPNNQYFDRSKNYCVLDDGQCRPTTTSTSTPSTTTTPKSTTTSSSSTTESTTRSTTTASTPSTTQSTTVKPDCIHGEFKEHEEECYKFQLCVNGIWRNQSCPNNQYFDRSKNYCVLDDGQCRPTTTSTSTTSTTTTPKSTTTSSSSTTESTTRSTTSTSTPSTTQSTTIKPECIHGEFKEHEEECYKFQLCVNGIWRNQSCPNNQYFDRSKNYCVLDDGQCRPTTTSTSTTSTTTTPKSTTTSSSSTTESTTTSTGTTSTPSTTQSTTVKPECIHGEFKEHDEECYKFKLCVNGIWRNQSCPNNQYFDRSKNYCVLDDGQCRPTTTSTSTTSTTTTPKSTTTSSSSTTESTTRSTTTTSTPSTTQSTTVKPECIHGEFKEHDEECYKFKLCVSGIWRNQSCPNNQYFDKSKNYCILDDGQCRPTTTSTSTTSKTTTPKSTTTSSSSTTESTTTSTGTTSTPSTTQSTTVKPECIHGEFKEHDEECYKFKLCVNGIWRNQSCPNNQYFDKSRNYCVLDDGTCRPTTTSTSTTSTTTTPKSTTTSSSSTTESTTTSTSTTSTPSTTQSTTVKPECIHGEFKEHDEECYKFKLCVNGIWRNQSCPNNQYFDKSKNYCVLDDGTCRPTTTSTSTTSSTTTPKSTTTSSSSTTESTTTSTSTISTPSTTQSTTVKPECIHGEFKEHDEECYKFKLCVNGIWRNQSCPNNQYFDKSKNYCVLDDGTCRPTTTSTSTTSTTTTPKSTSTSSSSTTESTTTSTSTTSTPSTTQSTTIKPECIHGEFKEHDEECYKFRLCVNGIWRNQSCPNNQYFDKSKNYCVLDDGTCRPTTTSTSTTSTTTTPKSTTTSSSSTTESTTTSTTTTTTPSTTQSTTIKPECIHGEFMEHEEVCYKFKLCVSGIWRNQSCPNNQYFDKSKNYCVPDDGTCRPTTTSTSTTSTTTTPKSTTTSSSSTTESTTTSTTTATTPSTTQSTTIKPECIHGEFKEHEEECYKFKLCVLGTWKQQYCPEGQYFNRDKNFCIPEDGTCTSTTSTTSTTTQATTKPTSKPNCQHGEYKEYSGDCTKFYLCVVGIWREQYCPEGQYFNQDKNFCIPEDGSCRSTTSTTSTTTQATTKPTSKPNCQHGEYKEYSGDCTKFYLCVVGIWREQYCPEGQYFNQYKNFCIPEDGSCRSTTSTTSTTTRATTKPTSKPNCQHGEYKEYSGDCTKFYLCVVGIWREQYCPEGQYFNQDKNFCIPEDGSCRSTTSTTSTTTQATTKPTSKPNCQHGEYKEYSGDCTKFYLCVVGIWREQYCPEGQYFNQDKNFCIPEDGSCRSTTSTTSTTTQATTKPTSKPNCQHGEYKEYSGDCTKFYLCVVGIWREQYCPEGQYFNQDKNFCIPEDGSCRSTTSTTSTTTRATTKPTSKPNCQHGEYKEYSGDCTKFYLCVVGIWREQYCPEGQYFNHDKNFCIPEDGSCRSTTSTTSTTTQATTTKATTKPTSKPNCQHGEYKEYSGDCTKFYLCVVGIWREQYCPEGQYFNQDKNFCIPEDGSCKSTTSTTSTTSEATTKPTSKPNCHHGEYKEYSGECTKFYLCVSGRWREQYCPQGQYFNIDNNFCTPDDGSCIPKTTTTAPQEKCVHGEYKQNDDDCAKFYLCVQGKWRTQNCPNNQFFDKKINFCVEDNGSCDKVKSNVTNMLSRTDLKLLKRSVDICNDKPYGTFLPHPQSCKKYIICLNGKGFEQSCDTMEYFDQQSFYCRINNGECNE